jgi:hypothetical protein
MHNDKPLYIDRIFGFFSQEQVHPFNAQQVLRVIISMIQGSTTQVRYSAFFFSAEHQRAKFAVVVQIARVEVTQPLD